MCNVGPSGLKWTEATDLRRSDQTKSLEANAAAAVAAVTGQEIHLLMNTEAIGTICSHVDVKSDIKRQVRS